MTNDLVSVFPALMALSPQAAPSGELPLGPFSLGKVITFLLLTLGPNKIIAPFAEMTRGRDRAFKRELALKGTLFAAIGLLAAATSGAQTLRAWEVSPAALQVTAGIVLFLVALRPVLEPYGIRAAREPSEPAVEPHASPAVPASTPPAVPASGSTALPVSAPAVPASKLAMLPLAYPTIVTPYGVAVVVLLATLRGGDTSVAIQIFAVTAAVLLLDLLAMLAADRIVRLPLVGSVLGIVGVVLGILQVALGVQAVVSALPHLGLAQMAGG